MTKKIVFTQFLVILVGLAILGRVFYFAVVLYEKQDLSQAVGNEVFTRRNMRGEIYLEDKNSHSLYPLAINKRYYNISLNPRMIQDGDLDKIQKIIFSYYQTNNKDYNEAIVLMAKIKDKIQKKDSYFLNLLSKIELDDPVAEEVKKAKIKGLYLTTYYDRYYPLGTKLAQLVGYYGYRGDHKEGIYGIEEFYNDYLNGNIGSLYRKDDVVNKTLRLFNPNYLAFNENIKLILTIDPNLNFKTDEILDRYLKKFGAELGIVAIMDSNTGAIIALSSWPSFDPNHYYEITDYNLFLNPLISNTFEPGSIFKIFTFALGYFFRKISPDEWYIDKGFIKSGTYVIKNAAEKVYGRIPLKEALLKSINTGVIYIVEKLSDEEYIRGLESLGLAELTEIDSPYEAKGSILNVYSNREIDKFVSSFGQGISMTPIRFMTAAASLINGGKLLKPYFLQKILVDDKVIYEAKPYIVRQVLDDYSRNLIKSLMVETVESGTARRAKIAGYNIGAKTGTAQISLTGKKGYSEDFIHSIISFVPYQDPRFLIFIRLDKPKNVRFAEETVVPALKEINEYLFYYYGIQPDQ